jgi:hypothetical protein
MRRLRVLYAGPALAGRSTSLACLSGACGRDGYPRHRLDGKEVHLPSGETVLLDAVVPYFGSLWFESLDAATKTNVDWARKVALEVVAFLPKVDGVVFVADSWRHRQEANLESLRGVLRDLLDAGLDVERLPFVFQCNKRDLADTLPFTQMAAPLATARCAHVESMALVGHGVLRALDSLVALIHCGAPGAATLLPDLASARGEAAPSSPRRLFEEVTMELTRDGKIRAALKTSTQEAELVLADGAIARAWPKTPAGKPGLAPGGYIVDVVERLVSIHPRGGWRVVRGKVVAARIRHRDARVVRREQMAFDEQSHKSFVMIGLPRAVRAAEQDNIADEAYLQVRAQGVGVVARRGWLGSRFELVSRGEMAVFDVGTDNEVHIWLGRDGAGHIVEVSFYGDEGAAVLRQMA